MGRKIVRKLTNNMLKREQFEEFGLKQSSKNTNQKYNETYGYKDFVLTESQQNCLDVIKNNVIVFIEGPAGVGKSLSVFKYAVEEYLKNVATGITVIRTPVEAGSDKVGFLPSDLNLKLEPHFKSTQMLLGELLNPDKVQADTKGPHARIRFACPNFEIGATWDNQIVAIDEGQQIQPLIMKLLMERIGVNSKLIIMGDPSQIYSGHSDRQGMRHAMSIFFDIDKDTNKVVESRYPGTVGYYKFTADDCQRSDAAMTVIKAYADHGQNGEVFKY